jgi:hypothetical protein
MMNSDGNGQDTVFTMAMPPDIGNHRKGEPNDARA